MHREGDVNVKKTLYRLFAGSDGDQTILDYLASILEDEHFEFGEDGEEAYEALGPFLVSTPQACVLPPCSLFLAPANTCARPEVAQGHACMHAWVSGLLATHSAALRA